MRVKGFYCENCRTPPDVLIGRKSEIRSAGLCSSTRIKPLSLSPFYFSPSFMMSLYQTELFLDRVRELLPFTVNLLLFLLFLLYHLLLSSPQLSPLISSSSRLLFLLYSSTISFLFLHHLSSLFLSFLVSSSPLPSPPPPPLLLQCSCCSSEMNI